MARCAAPAFIFAVPRILSLGALLVMTGCSGIVGVAPQAADLQLTTAWDAGASALQDLRPGSEGDGPEVVGVNPDMTPPIVPLSSPIRRIRRLSSREYNNVVRDLLGDNSQPANKFVVDAYQNGYDNGSAGLAVQSDQAVTYQSAAETLAATAVPRNLAVLLGGCDVVKQGAAACADAFINTFAARAYRRPLTTTEAQRLRDVFTAFSGAGGFNAGIQTMLEVVLQSPQFLYREELGPSSAVPAAGAPVTLTDYEVASELSFLLTGSIPDDALWQAAAKGRLKTTADYQAQATRLLGTPGAKETIRSFVHQWLTTDRLASTSKDVKFYPGFNPAMAASMATELDRFYDDVLWTGKGSLRELFTSNRSFADKTLGQLYGVTVAGPGFEAVTLDPNTRRGVMSRAGFLAVHSATDSSGPIARGVFLLESILCSPPPQPPANVPPAIPAGDPMVQNLTTRERFEQHVASPFCASCHNRIDGVGFGFEEFDGIGAYRTMENGKAVDSSGTIAATHEVDGPYTGVGELTTKLAGTHHLADCYIKQAYRYALGSVEPADDDLRALTSAFTTDAQMTDVLLAAVANPVFVTRVFESPVP